MTIEQFYNSLGGDYKIVLSRIPSEALIKRFACAFIKDGSFAQLSKAMQDGDRETAFRAAHTLKGVCANLGFENLRRSASELTEILRPQSDVIPKEATPKLQAVDKDYQFAITAISQLCSEN